MNFSLRTGILDPPAIPPAAKILWRSSAVRNDRGRKMKIHPFLGIFLLRKWFTFLFLYVTMYLVKIGTLGKISKEGTVSRLTEAIPLHPQNRISIFGGYIQNGTKSSVCRDCAA